VTICPKKLVGVRRQRLEPQLVAGSPRELVAALAHHVPVVLPLPLERSRDTEVRGRIACASFLVMVDESRIVSFVPPTDHQRMHVRLEVATHVEEPGSFRRAHPLVAIAAVVVGVEAADRSIVYFPQVSSSCTEIAQTRTLTAGPAARCPAGGGRAAGSPERAASLLVAPG
jgi:hypothetical protein